MDQSSAFSFISKIVDNYDSLKYDYLDAQTFDEDHYGFPSIYYKVMETDKTRVNAFIKAYEKYGNLEGKTVCEIGVGTLALTKHFLPHVKKAYLVESNPEVIPFIKSEINKNGWEDKVELIHGNALELELPEKVDFIIGELMSIFCANELQVQIFKHMRQFLKPEGKLLPEKITNLVQLGHASFNKTHRHYPVMFSRHLPELFTTQNVVNIIDLNKEETFIKKGKIQLTSLLSGSINSVYLHSWVQVAEGANFTGTDSLMPPTLVQIKKPIEVKAGQKLTLSFEFSYGTSLDEAVFDVEAS